MCGTARYYVYWLQSGSRAYIGATVDPARRLRQHNGELAGGAARTRGKGPWRFECVATGFRSWREALQYEWAARYHSRRCRSVASRRRAFEALGRRERWTSNSPLCSEVPVTLEHAPSAYGAPATRAERPAGPAVQSGREESPQSAKKWPTTCSPSATSPSTP